MSIDVAYKQLSPFLGKWVRGCQVRGVLTELVKAEIAAAREALLVEIESKFPPQEKRNPDDDENAPLCDEYNCDGRLHKFIAKIRESRH